MRRRSTTLRWLTAVAALGTTGCTSLYVGAGALFAVGGAAALVGECYDTVQITVTDAYTGLSRCDANVWAVSGEVRESSTPCFHLALDEGEWTVHAALEGYEQATTTVIVDRSEGGCKRHVHSVEMILTPLRPPAEQLSAVSR